MTLSKEYYAGSFESETILDCGWFFHFVLCRVVLNTSVYGLFTAEGKPPIFPLLKQKLKVLQVLLEPRASVVKTQPCLQNPLFETTCPYTAEFDSSWQVWKSSLKTYQQESLSLGGGPPPPIF